MSAPDRRAEPEYSRGDAPPAGAEPATKPRAFRALARRWGGGTGAAAGAGGGSLARVAAAVGLLGALTLILSDFSTLYTISVRTTVRLRISGHEHHHYALALLGLAAGGMSIALARGVRAAALALTVLGVVALAVGAIGDRNVVTATGVLGQLLDTATARAGSGYHLELVGGILILLGGVGALVLDAPVGRARGRVG